MNPTKRGLIFGATALAALLSGGPAAGQTPNTADPVTTPKLIFIHHSTGEAWLGDGHGQLGLWLRDHNYFVSDTNYGWGPLDEDSGGSIGDNTDIGHWYNWFSGPHHDTYLSALFAEFGQNSSYSRLTDDPAPTDENRIVMFKSCFPNSGLGGSSSDPIPAIEENPLRGQGYWDDAHTLSNAKGIYLDLRDAFASRPDKLFVLIVQPPLVAGDTDPTRAGNARNLANWLVSDYRATYPHPNLLVFDFFNVLTSDGGTTRINNPNVNDLGWSDGNHHRWQAGALQHMTTVAYNMSAYASGSGDSHPTAAGDRKATGEFGPLLNIAYHCWNGDGGCLRITGSAPVRVPGTLVPTGATTVDDGASIVVSWDAQHCPSKGYHLLYGQGSGLAAWSTSGGLCNLGTTGTFAWNSVPPPESANGFVWFLVVGDDGAGSGIEGSWGITTAGDERGGATPSGRCGMTAKNSSLACQAL
jgi:hypothetical protein